MQGRLIALHGFIKKTQQTPESELHLARKRKREFEQEEMMAKKKELHCVEDLSTLDDLLTEQGVKETFQAVAIKEVLAWQLEEAMKAGGFSRNALAKRMHTSPAQIRRLLNPADGNVTLATLQRAAELLGRTVRLELI